MALDRFCCVAGETNGSGIIDPWEWRLRVAQFD
jgi:hypothetical protein